MGLINCLNWLQSPELVVDFQKYFGIERVLHEDENSRYHSDVQKSPCSSSADSDDCSTNKGSYNASINSLFGLQMIGGNEVQDSDKNENSLKYKINNWVWHYIFKAATFTGDELFYTFMIPFWLWNVDGAVMRRVVVFWMVTMYIGQALKDLIKIPRPLSPPVMRLDNKWLLEYGMPSTHAAVGLALPGGIFLFSLSRYQIDWVFCSILVCVWGLTVGLSRIYLGMHSVLDVICGILLALFLFATAIPLIEALDHTILSHPIAPLLVFGLSTAMVAAYPSTASWNPARGDTAVILGVGCGILLGFWLNFQLGIIAALHNLSTTDDASPSHPYPILWPTNAMIFQSLVRTILGLLVILVTRHVVRKSAMRVLCTAMQVEMEDYLLHTSRRQKRQVSPLSRVQHCFIECGYKFITYTCIGLSIITIAPAIFRLLNVERPTFYTEV